MSLLDLMAVDPAKLKTEERLIVASVKVFSQYPVELASTRMIAKEAGVSLSAIPYYFKTKENLYQAAIERMVDFVAEGARQKFAHLPPVDTLSVAETRNVLQSLIETMIDTLCATPNVLMFARIIMREHLAPSPVYDVIYQRFVKRLFEIVTQMIRRVVPEMSEKDAMFRIAWSFGQIIGFRVGREMLMRHVDDFVGYSPEEIASIKALILRSIFRELELEQAS